MSLELDHLVVAASRLDEGVAWCETTLGVTPGPGGRHALFGTHNRVLNVASVAFRRAYLEIIAVDPDAPAPTRPRWFGLDEPALRARLARGPQLIHWVARSTALARDREALLEAGHRPGEPVVAARETPKGRLEWTILVPDDGRLGAGGALPTLIEWRGAHPTDAMPASGVALLGLELHGLDAGGAPALDLLDLPGVCLSQKPGAALCARLATPRGAITLESA